MLFFRTQVTALQCDVGCAANVAALAAAVADAGSGPITGIFHVGGALADATLAGQTAQSMRAVFAPKVQVLEYNPCDSNSKSFVNQLSDGVIEFANGHSV